MLSTASRGVKADEERLIEAYFDAFNRHDLDGVMACFHDDVVLVSPTGDHVAGLDAARQRYEHEFATMPDAHCELRMVVGRDGRGVAESTFRATIDGSPIRAIGTEVIEVVEGKIKEIRDYHNVA
jgi:taurine dehydrogenase small subunit